MEAVKQDGCLGLASISMETQRVHWLKNLDFPETNHPALLYILVINSTLFTLQDVTLQHYMNYTAESLLPVMAHIAKNVVKVNDGLTKHMVSLLSLNQS